MMIHEITAQAGAHKKRILRVGRGESSVQGGRPAAAGPRAREPVPAVRPTPGMKAEPSRSTPALARCRGSFNNNYFAQRFSIINISDLEGHFDTGATVDKSALITHGLIRDDKLPVKVLGDGELTKKLSVVAGKFSKQAAEKIAKAGGSMTTLELDRNKGKVDPKNGPLCFQEPGEGETQGQEVEMFRDS